MPTQTHLGRALLEARQRTDSLFALIRPDSLYERPIPERHRILFYVGHLEAFDWNLIAPRDLDLPSFNPAFDRLFAFGIDPPEGQLPQDQPSDWPSAGEVEEYNRRVRREIDARLDAVSEQLLHVAIEHREMHAETFAYILHQLAYDRKAAPAVSVPASSEPPRAAMIPIPAGQARVGRELRDGFGWDNEFKAHTVETPAFRVSKYKVTNREYLEDVREGMPAPFFWVERGGRWFYRGMFSEYPLPPDCPAYVTWREAAGYARRRGMRLLTEPEYHRAAAFSAPSAANDFRLWDPIPVNAEPTPAGSPAQMAGNGWEWTSTPFGPFPGFQPFEFYPNYSAPFFDGDHYVLKGASPRTAACFLRASFRNWFRSSYPYTYSTFRLVEG